MPIYKVGNRYFLYHKEKAKVYYAELVSIETFDSFYWLKFNGANNNSVGCMSIRSDTLHRVYNVQADEEYNDRLEVSTEARQVLGE